MELDLVIADDATVRDLNRHYRGEDTVTDVLSFPFLHPGEGEQRVEGPFPQPRGAGKSLGEVLVSYPQALRQAGEDHRPVQEELALLITHGVLHLLGYDHTEPDEEQRMKAQEATILEQVFSQKPQER